MTEHHSTRRARTLNRDRARQQSLRDRKRARASPSTHTVNRAIVFSIMAELKALRAQGAKFDDANVSVGKVFRGAYAYLTKGTHGGNSYSKEEVSKALVTRIKRDAPGPNDD